MNRAGPPADISWPLAWRIAFRFSVAFFAFSTLHLASGSVPVLRADVVNSTLFTPLRWSKGMLFGPSPFLNTLVGALQYLATVVLLASLVALIWSVVDRKRRHYQRAYAWGRVYLRYALCGIMLGYGFQKVLLLQFPPPGLWTLIQPFGDLSRMQLLWSFMGTSATYTVFSGVAESVGALLLLSRRTTTLGALLLAAVLGNLVLLNFAYEVPVGFNATIYLLMALALLAPEVGRLLDLLVRNRPVNAVDLSAGRMPTTWKRASLGVKVIVIAWLVGSELPDVYTGYNTFGRGMAPPVLYGIYDVEEFWRNGESVAPNAADTTNWHRLVIGERGVGAVQSQPGIRASRYELVEDTLARTLTLSPQDTGGVIRLHYVREGKGVLFATGRAGKDSVEMRLRAIDLSSFRLRQPVR